MAGSSISPHGVKTRARILPLVFVVFSLVVAACGAESERSGPIQPVPMTDGPEVRQLVIDLAGPAYLGPEFDPDAVAGRPIVLWFWGAF